MKFNSVVLKNLYHKIDLSPNLVFQRWRAYLKSWSAFPSLPLNKTKGRHIVVKICTTIKPKISRFVSLYIKRLRVNVRNDPTSVRKRTPIKPADAYRLN